jgi:hypothetical protein
MNLTTDDLRAIREIIKTELTVTVREAVKEELKPLSGELEALRNDIKEIYDMLSELEGKVVPDEQFSKLSLNQKLLKLNTELLAAAKQAGISLPR